jgi:cystathionine beta-lyase/cystathionine gamma-synthase
MYSCQLYNAQMNKSWKTKLIHSDVRIPEGFESLNVPVHRASTTIFPNAAVVNDNWDQYESGYTYGLYGTPTVLELAGRILRTGRRLLHSHYAGRTECHFADQPIVSQAGRSHPGAAEHLRTKPAICE